MKRTLCRLATVSACVLAAVTSNTGLAAQEKPAATPFDTKAVVVVKSDDVEVPLKREEQIAYMFVDAMKDLLDDCSRHAAEPCTLEALVRGPKPKDDWGMGKLRYDPNATDPNYTYTVTLGDRDWQIRADPRKAGLGGFYFKGRSFGRLYYNPGGPAQENHTKLTETSVSGELFVQR